MQRIHQVDGDREEPLLDLDKIARQGARRMLAEALEAEVQDYLEAARSERDENGHALVVRNGHATERQILCGAGSVEVRAPRVNDRRVDEDGNRQRFRSVILNLPTCAARQRSPRCCLYSIYTASLVETSCPPSKSSSAPNPGCRRPR